MRLLKLIHPILGICAQEVVHYSNNESGIKYKWKKRYGKKFEECSIDIDDDSPAINIDKTKYIRPDRFSKITEDIIFDVLRLIKKGYKIKDVSNSMGVSITTISRIKRNKKNNNTPYYTTK